MMFSAQPERTYGLIVGIEKYQESGWNVKGGGPVDDGFKFADWLCARGVPLANIHLCLSPLEENQQLLYKQYEQYSSRMHDANLQTIDNLITNFLSQKSGDLLFIFWAGHGFINSERERKLFCADATKQNWQNIDFNSLLLMLGSDAFQIRNHICIIDACANYILESTGRPTNLGGKIFNSGKPRTDSQRFVLFATREGEKAKVSAEEKTGYFSQAVREALEQASAEIFPPDMKAIAEEVKRRFASLDKKQLPTYSLYERDWDGNEKRYDLKPFKIPQNIPRSNTDKFIGRVQELKDLHQQLQRNDEVAITAVKGMGGVGKTELAIQYSLRHLELHTYPGGICWLRAREQDIGLQIIEFARINFDLQPPEDLELPERVRWCWQRWHQGNTLVVVDDVKDYPHITPYLPPQSSQFKVLITTRLKLDLAGSLFLEVLQEEDALSLLTQLVGEEKVTQEATKAKELVQRLGYLPLALQLVGRYVKKRKISLAEMLRRLEEKGLGHPSLEVKENDPTWTLDIKRGVAAAFELSWSELSESAQQLGCLLSLFANAPIPWSLVERAAAEEYAEELEDARVELEKLHLLVGEDTYQLHQLIREFLRDKQKNLASGDSQKSSFCQAMVEVAKDIPDTPNRNEITALTPAIPHLAEVAQNLTASVSDENLIWVFIGLGWFYKGQGLYALAQPWFEQCVLVVQSRLGEEHPNVATSFNNLAYLYYSQGRYTEAEPLYIKGLELNQRLLGEEHPDVAVSYNNLAALYLSLGRYTEAEPLLLKALELRQRLLGDEHPYVATSYNNLANLYLSLGRYTEAEPLHIKALELYQRLLGEEHPDVATSFNNLAALYRSQGRYTEAEPLYIKGLELTQRLLGDEHPDVAVSYNNLAGLYDSQGRYTEAEPLYIKGLELRQRLLGDEHPDVAQSYNNLAALYRSQGRYTEAEPLYIKGLELRQRLLGDEHPDVAQSYNNLAALYLSLGRYTDAEPLHIKALELYQRLLGEEHPSVAQSYNNLAALYYFQGRYTEAEPLLLKALEIAERSLGENHPNTITFRENLNNLRDHRQS